MEENYILVLIQSLEKKVKVLESLSVENEKQKKLLLEEDFLAEEFEKSIDKKSGLIEEIAFLDSGFEKLYQRVKELLASRKEEYRNEIQTLQKLISRITELTVALEKEEWENRNLAEKQFSKQKKKIRQAKNSKQVARTYHNAMAKISYIDPQFMDKKK